MTRGEISRLAGREISPDIIAALKRHGLIDGAIRAPQPGAPFAYVTRENSWRRLARPPCATCPTSNASKRKGCCGQGGDDDRDEALAFSGVREDEMLDEPEL
jgi:hypothetical protein